MQRRGEGGQPVKDQGARPKARNAPTGQESTDRSTEQFDRLKRERNEAREQQAATAEISSRHSRFAERRATRV